MLVRWSDQLRAPFAGSAAGTEAEAGAGAGAGPSGAREEDGDEDKDDNGAASLGGLVATAKGLGKTSLGYIADTLKPNTQVGVHFPMFAKEYARRLITRPLWCTFSSIAAIAMQRVPRNECSCSL